jgi:hypothetical protein
MATKPVKPGDRITWRQYSAPGDGWREPFERTGTVFAGAPTGNGLSNAWWVHPDQPEPNDPDTGGVVAVGRASRRSYRFESEPAKGEIYGSWYWEHQAAALTGAAATWRKAQAAARQPAYRLAA